MKWTTLCILVLIGLVGAWKEDQEYKYKLVTKTFVKLPISNKQNGVISRVNLTIRPQSNNVLIAQITRAGYVETDQKDSSEEQNSGANDSELAYRDIPLNQQFKIHLRNGAIHSLSVDRDMTNDQINFLKVIVSQFQVDTKAQNRIESEDNHLPQDNNGNDAYFKTMEPTVYGQCETDYDISALPEYLTQSNRESIPLPELAREGEVIQIIKTKNFENCKERTHYLSDLFGKREDTNRMDNNLMASQRSRIIVSGSLNEYTIQSVATTNKVADLNEYIYLTLESVEKRDRNYNYNYESNKRSDDRLNVVNLFYTYDTQKEARPSTNLFNSARPTTDSEYNDDPKKYGVGDGGDVWTKCYTGFVSDNNRCFQTFNAEWEPVENDCCGFLCLGQKSLCRRNYPGCDSTTCYSLFIPRDELCQRSFGDKLPVTKGGFESCAVGFWQSRCCPKSYE